MTWKTMDSAPYGIEIDILDKNGMVHFHCERIVYPERDEFFGFRYYLGGYHGVKDPLYWMPSPELPDEFKKGK